MTKKNFLALPIFFYFAMNFSMPGPGAPANMPQIPQPGFDQIQPIQGEESQIGQVSQPILENQAPPIPLDQQVPVSQIPIMDQMPVEPQIVSAGPQTVSLEESKVGVTGNWVKKREWLKQGQEINNEIQVLVDQIVETKNSFIDKIAQIDNELDSFYRQIGFKQGELQGLFDGLQNYLLKKRSERIAQIKSSVDGEGVTSEMEIKIDIVEDEIKNLKNRLEQFKLDMKSIEELDRLLGEHLDVLDRQIDLSSSDAEHARQILSDIWNMIDDKKARVAYYKLKGEILEKIKSSKSYVQTSLLSNLDSVISTIRNQITQIKNEIVNLESNGFVIKNRAKRIEQIKLKDLELLKAGQQIPKTDSKKEEKDIKTGNKIYNFFVDLAANIYSFYKSMKNFFANELDIKNSGDGKHNNLEDNVILPQIENKQLPIGVTQEPIMPVNLNN